MDLGTNNMASDILQDIVISGNTLLYCAEYLRNISFRFYYPHKYSGKTGLPFNKLN